MPCRLPTIAVLFAAALSVPRVARAEDVTVPVAVEIDLLIKVAAYDRSFARRAGQKVVTLVVTKTGDGDSQRVGTLALKTLAGRPDFAGLPHEEEIVPFESAPKLAETCKAKKAAVVFFAPGFSPQEIAEISHALEGAEVLTAASVARFVEQGIVLGFDLVAGKPKLHFSLSQANKQGVSISANVLSLMTVHP
jgi:hypothetical protein